VLQAALGDFSVQYTLLVSLEQPHRRVANLAALHANIQDAFNEFGVQIMSPNYEADPEAPKVVPRSRWYSAPATPDSPAPDLAAGTAGHEITR
jgi:small-conductance mechanosensitive channel